MNQIPSALVESIDVLTGGASAVYGADAVAGVVNFKMNDHFQGVRLDANDGFNNHSQHDGGAAADEAAAGFTTPTGSVTDGQTATSPRSWARTSMTAMAMPPSTPATGTPWPSSKATRDFAACSLTSSGPQRVCGGSGTTYPTRFSLPGGFYSVGAGGTLVPTASLPAGGLYNYAPSNYFQRPDERYTGGGFTHYDVNDHARVYMEFLFMDDRTMAQIAPSGAFTGSGLGVSSAGIPPARGPSIATIRTSRHPEYTGFGCTSPTDTAHVDLRPPRCGRRAIA